MRRSGVLELKLHYGTAPQWLVSRMVRLAKVIFRVMVDELGVEELLVRLSDPLFFQACSNVLGFDWDSSGSTTVTCGVLKDVFREEDLGIKAAGGKGEASKKTLEEIETLSEPLGLSTSRVEELKYASRMTAKVDSAAIQAGYQIYHHTLFMAEGGSWVVVQQGLNPATRTARRYHWQSRNLKSFVEEPHSGIWGEKVHKQVLDMTAQESGECRKTCRDLVVDNPDKTLRPYLVVAPPSQQTLEGWLSSVAAAKFYRVYSGKVNWQALREAYEVKPKDFQEVLAVKGIGPATVRGLALVSQLIYGAKPSWKDPLRFSFAFGGKDGVPFPVRKRAMEKAAEYLKQAVEAAELGRKDKLDALKRLGSLYS
ncbi:DUF763 domain-containing protein [Candidatus Hecatella orcuttiae]|uniref:DUF763 domain-containing protein n=1 Tax=Candidatus Hecatella orcuttiae TaxID=1935119 RepID=UPI0028680DBA|nr:DUF763 domain-containing protein [Candidatus Hecatella orcuttiae]